MSLNISPLFYTSDRADETFLRNISLSEDEMTDLLAARKALREALRGCLKTEVARALNTDPQSVTPKFVTQGSVSYKTLNDPCKPPQQADLDDGIYLPLSYVQETGQPAEAAEVLFCAVAACAKTVAETEGWSVETTNPRCTRVVVSDRMHIDIPLYSIPDDDFKRIVEARAFDHRIAVSLEEQIDLEWDEVLSDRVLLATRNEGWLAKDPRPIRAWVNEQVELKGEQLRRIMRYIKAWRDFQTWKFGDDPKSILLMVAVDLAFEEKIHGRDDLALLATVRNLQQILTGPITCPWDNTEDLAARLDKTPGLRQELIANLKNLESSLNFAIYEAITATQSCESLIGNFGGRLPNKPESVAMGAIAAQPARAAAAAGIVGRQNNA